jgi:hypothetical protein
VKRKTLQLILNVSLSNDSWRQAKLPVKLGGLGIMAASDIAIPAFIYSVKGAANMTFKLLPSGFCNQAGQNDVNLVDHIDHWQKIANHTLPDYSIAHQQSQWNKLFQLLVADVVLAVTPNQMSPARLLAAAALSSGDFLQAVLMSLVGT